MFPTLVLISLLAFALNECTPEAVIDPPRPDSGASALLRYDNERDNFKRLAELRGDHLPIFYLSIGTAAYPDTLKQILPPERQQAAKNLIAQFGNWPAIQIFNQELERLLRQGLALSDDYSSDALIEAIRLLQQLPIRTDVKNISRDLEGVQVALQSDSRVEQGLGAQLSVVQEAYQNLERQAQPWKHYVPTFQWNGRNNKYHRWISEVITGNLGNSVVSGQEVSQRVNNALRWTLRLNLSAFFIAYLLAIPLGVYTAVYAGSGFDRRLNIFLFFFYALPSFWVATLLTQFFATPEWFDIFPSMGVGDIPDQASWWERTRIRSYHFFLPVFCLTYGILAVVVRQVRTAMQSILESDFIRTARAKGISESRVVWRHAFPNALFPLITMFGNLLPRVVAGSIVIERIFSIPGVGSLTIDSILSKDWPIVYALLLLTAVLTVVGILLADLLYAWVDPRVQLGPQKQNANG